MTDTSAGTNSQAEAPPVGDVASRLLFENDRVKIWEMKLEPGESSQPHRHGYEYFFVVLEGESIDADFIDCRLDPSLSGKSIQLPVEPGKVFYVKPGNSETAVNRSPTRYREILVELKEHPVAD